MSFFYGVASLKDTATDQNVFVVDGNNLTTGNNTVISSTSTSLSSGELLKADHTASGSSITNKTGNLSSIISSRTDTRTSGTTADNFDVLSLKRTNVMNGSGGTLTSTGSILKIDNIATQTQGTLTDTVNGIELDMDADGTGSGVKITHSNAGSAKSLEIISSGTTGNTVDITSDSISTGKAISLSADALTTGSGFNITSTSTALAAGELFKANHTASGGSITNKTGNLSSIISSRTDTRTSGTTADDFDVLSLKRTSIINGSGGTLTSAGSILKLENVATQSAGTLTDTTTGIELLMDADGTGSGIKITHPNTGAAKSLEIISSGTSGNAVDITSDSTSTGKVLSISADGLTSGSALDITSSSGSKSSGGLVNIAQTSVNTSQTAATLAVATSATTQGAVASFTGSAMTEGNAVEITANALTTGNALKITSSSANKSAGALVRISQTGVDTAQSTSTLEVSTSATTSSAAGIASFTGNALTAGTAVSISGNSLTTGNAMTISATSLTTGSALKITTNETNATAVEIASGFMVMTPQPITIADGGSASDAPLNLFESSVIFIDMNDATDEELYERTVKDGSGGTTYKNGQIAHIFFDTAGAYLELNFGSGGLCAGSGNVQKLKFTQTGQSASLIYVNSKWWIINTGATVS